MRRSLLCIVFLLSMVPLVFMSCDTANEPPTLPVALKTTPSEELSSMVQDTPSDFTWDYFRDNVHIEGPSQTDFDKFDLVLSSFQVQNGEVVNRTSTEPIEVSADELSSGLVTEEIPPSLWMPGKDWVSTSNWFPGLVYAPGNSWTPSEVEDRVIADKELVDNETMVVVYAQLAGDSPEREQTTQPFGIIFQKKEQQEEVQPISQEVSASDASAARDFWTAERMMEASPVEGTGIGQDSEDPPAATTPDIPEPYVEMAQKAGSQPEFAGKSTTGNGIESDTQVDEASQVSSDYTQYPYRTVGKVFFTKDGNWFSCSAAVIASENRSVVWTAGHCVAKQGKEDWHDRWVFVPAYEDGEAPLGKWSARVKTTLTAWYSDGNRNYDVGAVVVEERDTRAIASVTGSLGWMFNAQRSQDWTELGYPGSGSLFSGQKMWQCSAPYDGGDGVGSNSGPRTSKITDCDYTAGASGGPWVASFDNCPQCYINGANSWWWWRNGHSNLAIQWASAYHGSAAHSLLQFAEGF